MGDWWLVTGENRGVAISVREMSAAVLVADRQH
jgi:hypothetical protein